MIKLKYLGSIASLLLFASAVAANDFKVIGYSMNPASEIVQQHAATYITDLIYFSIEPNPDGTLATERLTPEGLAATKAMAQNHGIRIYLAVGGWGRSTHFAEVAATADSRARFINNMIALCQRHGFEGIDLDWEFPEGKSQYEDYATLLVETKAAFAQHDLVLSAALSPWQKLNPKAYKALDRVHLMAYDFPQKHSTFDDSTNAVRTFLSLNIPKKKLYFGVPFYGRNIDERNKSITYNSLVTQHDLTPDTDEVDRFYFNGPTTIRRKVDFARQQQLAGIMIWEIGQDSTGKNSLLKAIHKSLSQKTRDAKR